MRETRFVEEMNDNAKGKATCSSDISRSTTSAYRRRGAGSALLGFTCGLCVFLSLLCSCLTALVVVMNDKIQTASLLTGEKKFGNK